MGLRPRDSALARARKGYCRGNQRKLVVELLRRHDYADAAQLARVERLSHFHVLELLVHPAGGKFFLSTHMSHETKILGRHRANTMFQFFCYPETANLTLEEVDWLFYKGDVVRRSRQVAKSGWEAVEGQTPDISVLETGTGSFSSKKEDGLEKRETGGVEKREDLGGE
jgi:hypothetical protein